MKRVKILAVLLGIVLLPGCNTTTTDRQWSPEILEAASDIYLPDFSYAGYHWGEKAIPDHPATGDVTDFGAVPDDGNDDTDAILAAVAAAQKQPGTAVVGFPPGRFILTRMLFIERSNLVLQGSGSGEGGTTLYLPVPMKEMEQPESINELQKYLVDNDKRVKSGELFSPFSWTGGIIWPRVKDKRIYAYLEEHDRPPEKITAISEGRRGEHTFTAASTVDLKEGDLVRILWFNPDGEQGSLLTHLYGRGDFKIGSRHWEHPHRALVEQIATITGVDGNRVSIRSPLLHDLRSEWGCALAPANLLTEVGIEHFRIEFPEIDYAGHHLEEGYNAIYLTSVAHGWVRDIHFVNADNAILSDDGAHVTIEDITFSGRRTHYTTHAGKVNHFLVKNITVSCPAEHSISFNTFSKASVYTDVDILQTPSLDQHCGTNHQNLFDNIRIAVDQNPLDLFRHGGAGYWKPTHGLYNTFWNIRLDFAGELAGGDTLVIEEIKDGPEARLVGIYGNYPLKLTYGPQAYLEGINSPGIALPSLYRYQLRQRLGNP